MFCNEKIGKASERLAARQQKMDLYQHKRSSGTHSCEWLDTDGVLRSNAEQGSSKKVGQSMKSIEAWHRTASLASHIVAPAEETEQCDGCGIFWKKEKKRKRALWICCDFCPRWAHATCVGIDEKKADKAAYTCYYCQKKLNHIPRLLQ